MKRILKIGVLAALATIAIGGSYAQTISLMGKLTKESAYNINDIFVRNSGITENVDPYKADAVLLQITDVAPEDVLALEDALNRWIKCYKIDCFKINISRAESRNKKVALLGEHAMDEATCLRGKLTRVVECTQTPTGTKYTTFMSCRGIFVPLIHVGVTGDKKAKHITWMINKRLHDDDLIYPAPHFQVEVESLHLETR